MDCPTCATELKRIQYENTPVLQCEQCLGYLVKQKQMLRIRVDRSTSVQQLQEQTSSEQQPDTADHIRCPRCRAVKMKKKAVRLEDHEMLLDCCPKCDHVWFDGGELSKWQADYEHSKQAAEAKQHMLRSEMRTDEQKQETQERIDAAPRMQSATQDIIFWCLIAVFGVSSVIAFFVGQLIAAILCSLVATGILGWYAWRQIDGLWARVAAVVGVVVLEVVILIVYCAL